MDHYVAQSEFLCRRKLSKAFKTTLENGIMQASSPLLNQFRKEKLWYDPWATCMGDIIEGIPNSSMCPQFVLFDTSKADTSDSQGSDSSDTENDEPLATSPDEPVRSTVITNDEEEHDLPEPPSDNDPEIIALIAQAQSQRTNYEEPSTQSKVKYTKKGKIPYVETDFACFVLLKDGQTVIGHRIMILLEIKREGLLPTSETSRVAEDQVLKQASFAFRQSANDQNTDEENEIIIVAAYGPYFRHNVAHRPDDPEALPSIREWSPLIRLDSEAGKAFREIFIKGRACGVAGLENIVLPEELEGRKLSQKMGHNGYVTAVEIGKPQKKRGKSSRKAAVAQKKRRELTTISP